MSVIDKIKKEVTIRKWERQEEKRVYDEAYAEAKQKAEAKRFAAKLENAKARAQLRATQGRLNTGARAVARTFKGTGQELKKVASYSFSELAQARQRAMVESGALSKPRPVQKPAQKNRNKRRRKRRK